MNESPVRTMPCGLPEFPWSDQIIPPNVRVEYIQKLKVKKLFPDAKLPTRATPDSAGLDMYAHSEKPYGSCMVEYGTGIAVEIPEGYTGFLFPRSSITERSMRLANCVGVLDPDYRGEIKFRFDDLNLPDSYKNYEVGERIGQLILLQTPRFEVVEVEELSQTERGSQGFGSSGK